MHNYNSENLKRMTQFIVSHCHLQTADAWCVLSVRQKVKELVEFVKDDEKLRDERKKAKKNKDKYVGMSSFSASMRYGKSV